MNLSFTKTSITTTHTESSDVGFVSEWFYTRHDACVFPEYVSTSHRTTGHGSGWRVP